MTKTIFFASDHNGIELRHKLIEQASNLNIYMEDLGIEHGSIFDYVDISSLLAQQMKEENGSFGVLICGSGIGASISVNRYQHIRAALCRSREDAILTRQQNNANVLCLGAKFCDEKLALQCLKNFIETKFNHEKHGKCVEKI